MLKKINHKSIYQNKMIVYKGILILNQPTIIRMSKRVLHRALNEGKKQLMTYLLKNRALLIKGWVAHNILIKKTYKRQKDIRKKKIQQFFYVGRQWGRGWWSSNHKHGAPQGRLLQLDYHLNPKIKKDPIISEYHANSQYQ